MILRSWSFSIGRVRPHPFEFLQSDFFEAIPLPATQVRIAIWQYRMKYAFSPRRLGYFRNRWGISHTGQTDLPVQSLSLMLLSLLACKLQNTMTQGLSKEEERWKA
jgi:hypothetical protein